MPNQPKTPAHTFRLSDDTMQQLRDISAAFGSMSDAVRSAIESTHRLQLVTSNDLSETAQAIRKQMSDDELALNDVTYEGALPELSRVMLNGATRYAEHLSGDFGRAISAEIRSDERERTIRDIITRLEGYAPGHVDQYVIDMLRSLL